MHLLIVFLYFQNILDILTFSFHWTYFHWLASWRNCCWWNFPRWHICSGVETGDTIQKETYCFFFSHFCHVGKSLGDLGLVKNDGEKMLWALFMAQARPTKQLMSTFSKMSGRWLWFRRSNSGSLCLSMIPGFSIFSRI